MKIIQRACAPSGLIVRVFRGAQPPPFYHRRVCDASPTPPMYQNRLISTAPSTFAPAIGVPAEDEEMPQTTKSMKKPRQKSLKPEAKSCSKSEGSGSTGAKTKKEKEDSSFTKAMQLTMTYTKKHSGISSQVSNLISKPFLRPTKTIPNTVYLVNHSVAKSMTEIIKSAEPDLDAPVLELHPGPGVLTSDLINDIGFKYVTCLEDNPKLAESIRKRFNLPVIQACLNDLPRHFHLDKHDGGERIHNILNKIRTKPPDTPDPDPSTKKQLYVVGALVNVSEINFIIRCYVTQRVLFEEDTPWSGRVTFFTGFGGRPDLVCNATPETGLVAYRATSVLFQTLFNCKELGELPREAFIPWEVQDKTVRVGPQTRKMKVVNPEIIKMFRIEANQDTLDKIGKEHLFLYWYFVRQSLFARTCRIIPELEKWVPGCGPRLIKQGMTIYSQFGTLKPHEILDLYLQFVSWPEFGNSSFLSAVEKFQTRLEISDEDGGGGAH